MANEDLGKCSTGIQPNVAGLLCYLVGIISGLIFFLIEKENKYVRFHAMQSMLIFGAFFVLNIVLGLIPVVGWGLLPVASILELIIWIVMMVKAYQGEKLKLPIVGDIAEKNA